MGPARAVGAQALTVGDFEDLQRQLLRTREELCAVQTRERAGAHELSRLRTEHADLALYSKLQATRESLLREDVARLQRTLERCVGVDGGPASPTADRSSDVAAFPAPPTPSAQRRLDQSVGSAAAQIGRLEVERDALRASLACADADGARADEQLQSVRLLLSQSRGEQHQLLAALRERERALHETRQFAAALHVRVARSDSDAAAERASLHEAASSSEELSAAYRDAQRVVAKQHAAAVEQLRAVKRAAGLRMARAAAEGAARCALRGWRHAVERAQLVRRLRARARGRPAAGASEPAAVAGTSAASSSMALALAALADAPLLADDEAPWARDAASSDDDASDAESGAERDEATRCARMRRWWTAEVRALADELRLADADLARAAERARAERAARGARLDAADAARARSDAERACAVRAVVEADEAVCAGVDACSATAQQRAVLALALADADAQLAAADARARSLELAVTDGKVDAELRARRGEIMVRELQRSLREEVAAHARTRDESAAQADEAALAAAAATAAAVEAAREEATSAAALGLADGGAPGVLARAPSAARLSSGAAATAPLCAAAADASASTGASSPRRQLGNGGNGGNGGGESGAWGELSRAPSSHELEDATPAPSSWLHAVGLGGSWTAAEPASATGGASAHAVAILEGAMARASADSVCADALLLKLRHLSAQNGFLRERVSHLEGCVLELHADLDKKKTLMRHLYAVANGPLPPHASEDVASSVVQRWVRTLTQPTVSTMQPYPSQRREREVADAMEVVLEETLFKNIQLQTDIESLSAQCVRLRRLLAESYQGGSAASAPDGSAAAADPNRESRVDVALQQ